MEEKKVLLSVQDLVVKFKVRGRSLTAIRGISLDIYDGESIAIVGESGSGKSVFTKTFANMLDSNGYVDSGKIIFNDPDLAEVTRAMYAGELDVHARISVRIKEFDKDQILKGSGASGGGATGGGAGAGAGKSMTRAAFDAATPAAKAEFAKGGGAVTD